MAYKYPPYTFNCLSCGVQKTVAYRFRGQTFCRAGCVNTYHKTVEKVEVTCTWCHETFKTNPSYAPYAKYCSIEHFHLFLRKGNERVITIHCENCGKPRDVPYINRSRRFCNHSCANSGEFNNMYGVTGPDHPMYGRPAWNRGLTIETDERVFALGQKISAWAKQQFADGVRTHAGENNPNYGYTREDRTPEQLENYSKAAAQRVLDGVIDKARKGYIQGYYTSQKTGDDMFYRSSYELRFMQCLDIDDNVTDYVYEPFSIKVREGTRYIPDFLIAYADGRKELVEVKPACFLDDEAVIAKGDAARQLCEEQGIGYRMVTLEDIKVLEASLVL